jgi:predicted alpha/beta hydrolase
MAAGLRLELPAGDGSRVVARRFDSAAPAGVVVIGAALAVPQAFYFDFAAWLAQQGFTALTFDYRGIGHGAPRSLRGFRASIDDWIRHDYQAVVVEARRLAGGLPLTVVGHSMGAQLVPLLPSAREAYARVRFPLLSLSFTDDRMMPERNIDALHAHLHGVLRQSLRLSPADAGGPIGHVGFFRRRYRDSLWPVARDWIAARSRSAGASRCC